VSEFTGERVIPGQVNDDLWAEHFARYAFAARCAMGKRVLDAGCGTGYGAAELSRTAIAVTGIDVAAEAIQYARTTFTKVQFVQASVTAMPFAAGSFGLITAFEVIEHLKDWPALLKETRRVLCPGGMFLVSTPNRLYYAETRAREGPNPFHVREFAFDEFGAALGDVFSHVRVLLQNRAESLVFHEPNAAPGFDARVDSSESLPEDAHFFLAVCSDQALPDLTPFLYVPRAANILREREQHIRLLEQELVLTKQWLDQVTGDHQKLQTLHEDLNQHLDKQNQWALELEKLWKTAQERVQQLQNDLAAEKAAGAAVAGGYAKKVAELEQESRQKTQWAMDTEARLTAELAAAVRLLDAAEATVVQRTEWAQNLDAQLQQLQTKLEFVRQSRWLKLGRSVGLGPELNK
jgi:SAM-dependent methyltransferase